MPCSGGGGGLIAAAIAAGIFADIRLYLLAVDDNGNAFEVSADPLKDDLQAKLAGIEVGKPETFTNQLDDILSNASIFGTDLTKTVLADKIKAYFKAELAGPGAVRKTLHDAVNA